MAQELDPEYRKLSRERNRAAETKLRTAQVIAPQNTAARVMATPQYARQKRRVSAALIVCLPESVHALPSSSVPMQPANPRFDIFSAFAALENFGCMCYHVHVLSQQELLCMLIALASLIVLGTC